MGFAVYNRGFRNGAATEPVSASCAGTCFDTPAVLVSASDHLPVIVAASVLSSAGRIIAITTRVMVCQSNYLTGAAVREGDG